MLRVRDSSRCTEGLFEAPADQIGRQLPVYHQADSPTTKMTNTIHPHGAYQPRGTPTPSVRTFNSP